MVDTKLARNKHNTNISKDQQASSTSAKQTTDLAIHQQETNVSGMQPATSLATNPQTTNFLGNLNNRLLSENESDEQKVITYQNKNYSEADVFRNLYKYYYEPRQTTFKSKEDFDELKSNIHIAEKLVPVLGSTFPKIIQLLRSIATILPQNQHTIALPGRRGGSVFPNVASTSLRPPTLPTSSVVGSGTNTSARPFGITHAPRVTVQTLESLLPFFPALRSLLVSGTSLQPSGIARLPRRFSSAHSVVPFGCARTSGLAKSAETLGNSF